MQECCMQDVTRMRGRCCTTLCYHALKPLTAPRRCCSWSQCSGDVVSLWPVWTLEPYVRFLHCKQKALWWGCRGLAWTETPSGLIVQVLPGVEGLLVYVADGPFYAIRFTIWREGAVIKLCCINHGTIMNGIISYLLVLHRRCELYWIFQGLAGRPTCMHWKLTFHVSQGNSGDMSTHFTFSGSVSIANSMEVIDR